MADPNRGWWTHSRRGYRLTREGAAGLQRLGFDQRAGQYVSQKRLTDIRDAFIDSRKPIGQELARQVKAGEISPSQWVLRMREEIKTTHIAEYVLAKGGLNNMTQSDWGRIGQTLRTQYGFLNDFASGIVTNEQWSEKYITARSNMYFEAAGQSYEQGKAAALGLTLPQYPADGRTQCLSNCKCYWDIRDKTDRWECTWTLRPAEHCPDCVENSRKWRPLVIPKTAARSILALRERLATYA